MAIGRPPPPMTLLQDEKAERTVWARRRRRVHPRFHVHFTPTYISWLNLVECWFSVLSRRKLKRSSHGSTRRLEQDIAAFPDATNDDPQPFIWTKSADDILDSIRRFCLRISDSVH